MSNRYYSNRRGITVTEEVLQEQKMYYTNRRGITLTELKSQHYKYKAIYTMEDLN